jgi:hypothetical protein
MVACLRTTRDFGGRAGISGSYIALVLLFVIVFARILGSHSWPQFFLLLMEEWG